MIKVCGVSFAYGKAEILKNISLEFGKGKLYAIVGPNGCGKTTLIKLLSGLNKPKAGSLTLDGQPYSDFKRKEFAKHTALLPQGRNIPNMSVYDFVACGRFPHLGATRRLTAEDEASINTALKSTGTEMFAEKSLRKLSGGERQRVYIAMLLAQNSPYLLLDEPTTHLDISAKFDILSLMCNIKQNGKCVIAVLHDLELALKYSDEIILMLDGEVLSKASPCETVKSGLLNDAFKVNCKAVELDGETRYFFNNL